MRDMDQPTMMSENAFQSGDTASCNLSEIWPFSISGGGGESCGVGDGGGGLKLRRLQFGSSLSQFGEANVNRDVCGKDEVGVELRGGGHGIGDGRKRREAVAAEDEAAKGVSTSGDGNGMDNDSDGKRVRASGFRDDNHNFKAEDEGNAAKGVEQNNKPEPPKDYIHVRARRGQATDSHSLAERDSPFEHLEFSSVGKARKDQREDEDSPGSCSWLQ